MIRSWFQTFWGIVTSGDWKQKRWIREELENLKSERPKNLEVLRVYARLKEQRYGRPYLSYLYEEEVWMLVENGVNPRTKLRGFKHRDVSRIYRAPKKGSYLKVYFEYKGHTFTYGFELLQDPAAENVWQEIKKKKLQDQ